MVAYESRATRERKQLAERHSRNIVRTFTSILQGYKYIKLLFSRDVLIGYRPLQSASEKNQNKMSGQIKYVPGGVM